MNLPSWAKRELDDTLYALAPRQPRFLPRRRGGDGTKINGLPDDVLDVLGGREAEGSTFWTGRFRERELTE